MEVIAHRGLSSLYPENTLIAFQEALNAKSDMIELDVRPTNDGQIFVFHDSNFQRICNDNRRTSDIKWQHIAQMDIGSWKSKEFSQQRPLTLEQTLIKFSHQISLNIELKFDIEELNQSNKRFINNVLHLIEENENQQNIIVSTFFTKGLEYLRSLSNTINIGVLAYKSQKINFIQDLKAVSYHPYYKTVTKDMVKMIHGFNAKVYPYTADNRKEWKQLINYGVDGIITNRPQELLHYQYTKK